MQQERAAGEDWDRKMESLVFATPTSSQFWEEAREMGRNSGRSNCHVRRAAVTAHTEGCHSIRGKDPTPDW